MARFSKQQFEKEIEQINMMFRGFGVDLRYIPGYRYGYAAVDWCRDSDGPPSRSYINPRGTICSGGTKREMVDKARRQAVIEMLTEITEREDRERWQD